METFLKTWKKIGYIKANTTIDMDDMESTQEGNCLAMQEPTEDDSSTDGSSSVDSDNY